MPRRRRRRRHQDHMSRRTAPIRNLTTTKTLLVPRLRIRTLLHQSIIRHMPIRLIPLRIPPIRTGPHRISLITPHRLEHIRTTLNICHLRRTTAHPHHIRSSNRLKAIHPLLTRNICLQPPIFHQLIN